MTTTRLHPLKYVAMTLSQMARTLKDFNMPETAALLEQATSDIEKRLARKSEKSLSEVTRLPRRGGLS